MRFTYFIIFSWVLMSQAANAASAKYICWMPKTYMILDIQVLANNNVQVNAQRSHEFGPYSDPGVYTGTLTGKMYKWKNLIQARGKLKSADGPAYDLQSTWVLSFPDLILNEEIRSAHGGSTKLNWKCRIY